MRIMLACATGMSTGMLVQRMKEYAENQVKDYKIWAIDVASVKQYVGKFDVLLLGPQVSYKLEDVKKLCNAETPVGVIKPVDYGRMNGAAVVQFAESLISARGK